MQPKAILIDRKDTVATALCPLEKGTAVRVELEDIAVDVSLSQDIPFGHKFALADMQPGAPVMKYGEPIGLAIEKIRKGEHVHVHNMESQKGRGDRK